MNGVRGRRIGREEENLCALSCCINFEELVFSFQGELSLALHSERASAC